MYLCVIRLWYLLTKWSEVECKRKNVAPGLFVALTLGKVKVEPQQRNGQEWWKFSQFSRLQQKTKLSWFITSYSRLI